MKKEIIHTPKEQPRNYPYLGIHSCGTIVLFTSKYTGVCMEAKSGETVYEKANNWSEKSFKEFEGSITLEN
jgi:hypothetical protein